MYYLHYSLAIINSLTLIYLWGMIVTKFSMSYSNLTKAVFFDWFNTLALYEPPREELHSQIVQEFGIDVSPPDLLSGILAADKYIFAEIARSPMTKRSREEQGKIYCKYAYIMLKQVGYEVDSKVLPQIINRWPQVFNRTMFVLFDDVILSLKTLKERGLTLGLITNATKDAVSAQHELGLEPYLNFTVTSEEAGTDKPDPAIFLLALERARVSPWEAIHVGDQYELDVGGARRAGITPIMIDRYNLYPEVDDCPRISTLPELLRYL